MLEVMLLCLCCWNLVGVFGTESVSVTEGDSVTLYMNVNETQRKEGIMWKFGHQEITIAEIKVKTNDITLHENSANGRFRDRLQLNKHTGSLTINNSRITDSGVYKVISTSTKKELKIFSITVYAGLSVPIISRDSPQCSSSSERSSSSTCVLLCSVMNVTHVTLSWYKGNSLFSSISVSDLNIRLSLPLEVEYQDTNTYSCVLNNPITNQTQHLNITDVCQCSGVFGDTDEVKTETVSVMEGDSLTLHTDLTHIQRDHEILWRFENNWIARIKRKINNNPMYDNNDERFRDRLLMNNQTGDLTITNIRSEHTGLYTLDIFIGDKEIIKRFSVTVYAPPSTVSGQL